MARKKITVIGAGNVGASVAAYASAQQLGDVVLLDILEGIPQGKGLDLYETIPVLGVDTKVVGTENYEESRGSDVIVVTAGIARKPGMSRDDLLATNVKIVAEVAQKAAAASPDAIMLVVSNPLDAMVYTAWKKSGAPGRSGSSMTACTGRTPTNGNPSIRRVSIACIARIMEQRRRPSGWPAT